MPTNAELGEFPQHTGRRIPGGDGNSGTLADCLRLFVSLLRIMGDFDIALCCSLMAQSPEARRYVSVRARK